jgi:hypothetical protein
VGGGQTDDLSSDTQKRRYASGVKLFFLSFGSREFTQTVSSICFVSYILQSL